MSVINCSRQILYYLMDIFCCCLSFAVFCGPFQNAEIEICKMVQSYNTSEGIKPASLINVSSYSDPNIAIKCIRVHLFKAYCLSLFFLQNHVEAPDYAPAKSY